MSSRSKPTISAVVAAYQAEAWIGEALDSILSQTRPPDEVIVVDDGSTDGTARELRRFGAKIQVIGQENRGCPGAFNTAFKAAQGEFVAMCGADDIWVPQKLEWQQQAIEANPQADVLSGHATLIGRVSDEHLRPPGTGMLDSVSLRNAMFHEDCICAPSVVIRRSLFTRLGPFVERFAADDYEYWLRALRAGARFYYDPRTVVYWRQHSSNLSGRLAWMDECSCQVRRWYKDDLSDRQVVCDGLAPVLFRVARRLVDQERPADARRTFMEALRYAPGANRFDNARALAWIAVLTLPAQIRRPLGDSMVKASRAVDDALGVRQPTCS